jgi:hypothetical protein
MLTSTTSSQFGERLPYGMLTDGHCRKFLTQLWDRLDGARTNVFRAFETMGLKLLAEPNAGMFAWARFPEIEDGWNVSRQHNRIAADHL